LFTDARKDKPGRFAVAGGGTVFLDEIGDVSSAMQSKLLRVLQERTYEPLGSVDPVSADVRVIAASNRDLGDLVRKGIFREDLYYRVNVVRVQLPPLRDRREDIALLVEHFVAKFNRLQQKNVAGVSEEVMAILLNYDYPGNIREVENIIEHAFVLCRRGLVEPGHLPAALRDTSRAQGALGKGELTLRPLGNTRSTRVWAKRSMLPAARRSLWRCRTQRRSSAVFSSGTRVARASPARTSRAMPAESMRSL
jgi:transcriptional regulator with PAS, ATPase and Fis domain